MGTKLTFGYLYDFRNPAQWRKPWTELYSETLDFIEWTEDLGFHGAWVPEHHVTDDGFLPSPLPMLGAIAARTKTIRIGTAIALAPLHHPVRFAQDCAVLDILSQGRLEMAVAVGYRESETQCFGVPFKSRGTRMEEFLQIVRRLWAGETVTHESAHFSISNATIMPQPLKGHVPLYVGGFNSRALKRAAIYGDGYHGKVDLFPSYRDQVLASGKDPSEARLREHDINFFVARDPDKAWEELAPSTFYMREAYARWMAESRGEYDTGDVVLKPMTMEEYRASGILTVMTPDDAIAHFRDMLDQGPVEHFMMSIPPGIPFARFREYAELFASEVMPAFA